MKVNFHQQISLGPLTTRPDKYLSTIYLVVSLVCLFISLGYLVNHLRQLQQPTSAPSGPQLLNQKNIEDAINLLQEQTINFNLEE